MSFVRPPTLKAAANLEDIKHFFPGVRNFLDKFYSTENRSDRQEMLAEEPEILGIPRLDAYLAAVAEHLCLKYDLEIPSWVNAPSRFLGEPYFPAEMQKLKATFIKESPSAFRRRLIFVDADPLIRPLRNLEKINAPTF